MHCDDGNPCLVERFAGGQNWLTLMKLSSGFVVFRHRCASPEFQVYTCRVGLSTVGRPEKWTTKMAARLIRVARRDHDPRQCNLSQRHVEQWQDDAREGAASRAR